MVRWSDAAKSDDINCRIEFNQFCFADNNTVDSESIHSIKIEFIARYCWEQ